MKRPQAEHQLDWTRQFPNDSDTCKITLNIIAFVCCEQQINFRHLDLIPIRVAKTAGKMLKRGRAREREREGVGASGSTDNEQAASNRCNRLRTNLPTCQRTESGSSRQ